MSHNKIDAFLPLRPLPKPRAWGRSWVIRSVPFREFRDTMHAVLGKYGAFEHPVRITILVNDWRRNGDPDNILGGILDCLKPVPLRDDTWSQIESITITRTRDPIPGGGFNLVIEEGLHYAGNLGATSKQNQDRHADRKKAGPAQEVQERGLRGKPGKGPGGLAHGKSARNRKKLDGGKA